jgi:phospholipid/cholesterol/gamma-HCH transport system permease protein
MLSAMLDAVAGVGRGVLGLTGYIGGVTLLGLSAAAQAPGALMGRKARLGRSNLAFQAVRVGVRSVPVVFIVSIFIGIILALQTAQELRRYGIEKELAPRVAAIGIIRELGPLISSLILAGYAGAAIAAELGTMVVGEEIEALVAGAMDPVRFLVVPRVLATVVMVTCLAVFADIMGLIGSYVTGVFVLGLEPSAYVNRMIASIAPFDFLGGLAKAVSFGLIIGLVSCYEGLGVSGGAEGVGRATTRTVVNSGVCIIASDCLFTAVFFTFGLI